jgi:hypothetical protein
MYNKAISNLVDGTFDLNTATARAFEAVLTNTGFDKTQTVLSEITLAPNTANVPLVNVTLDDTSSAGNTIWKTATDADTLKWTLTGTSNANAVVFYANTGAAAASTKMIARYELSSWFNGVLNDSLTLLTNQGIIRIDDPNT